MAKTFLGLRFEREIDLADKRPFAKGAEIPGYKAEVYRSYDKSARVGGLSFAIDSGRQDKALQEGRTLQVGRQGPRDRREGHVRRRGPRGDDRAVRTRARGEARPGHIARVEVSKYLHEYRIRPRRITNYDSFGSEFRETNLLKGWVQRRGPLPARNRNPWF